MTTSTFAWLRFDDAQAQQARELVRALQEPGTLDSLGIGGIRDGISDLLFPGTSTLHTRARYFLLVPWAMRHVARRSPRSREQYDKWLRDAELKTITALIAGNDAGTTGIIGRERGKAIRQTPSVVYWNALEKWGIRASRLRRSAVRDFVVGGGRTRSADALVIWNSMPDPPHGFLDEPMSILPSPWEADYLLERMGATRIPSLGGGERDHPSLLARVAQRPEQAAAADAPWNVDDTALTDHLRELLNMAEGFSLVIRGAHLLYLDLLYRAKANQQRIATDDIPNRGQLIGLLDEWVAEMESRKNFTAGWVARLPGMLDYLRGHGVRIGASTENFVQMWCRQAVEHPQYVLRDPKMAQAIREREESLKISNARLSNPSPLIAWNGELLGSARLTYRWEYARAHVLDCIEGKEAVHARA